VVVLYIAPWWREIVELVYFDRHPTCVSVSLCFARGIVLVWIHSAVLDCSVLCS
jgi:hypothetical protein